MKNLDFVRWILEQRIELSDDMGFRQSISIEPKRKAERTRLV